MNVVKVYIKELFCFLTFSLLGIGVLQAQSGLSVKDYVQLNAIGSVGENAPFWLVSNKDGISSLDNYNGHVRYGVQVDGTIGGNGAWRYSSGLDLKTGYNQTNTPVVHQLYADVSYKWLTLSVGSKQRVAEMRDFGTLSGFSGNAVLDNFSSLALNGLAELGTGGLVYSGNSSPIPQVRIGVPEYATIKGTGSLLHMRGHISYGVFLDSRFQENFTAINPKAKYNRYALYHSKAFFMKVGNEEIFPFEAEGGLEMHSQFGGDVYTHGKGKYLSMPTRFKDFLKAFIPAGGDELVPFTEQSNITGNQVGNWHLAFTLHTKPLDIRLYGEHMFEDFSQLFFIEYQNNINNKRTLVYYPWRDMLLGLSIKNKTGFLDFISNISYEYLSTYDQSGAGYNDPSDYFVEQMDGLDNYYNHAIYSGWHYYGMGIGNPLVFSPLYNKDGSLEFKANRLRAHHFGINGAFGGRKEFMYRLLYTYSENWGTYVNPFFEKKYTTSLLADFIYSPHGKSWLLSASIAHDRSNYIGNNTGVMFSFVKVGLYK